VNILLNGEPRCVQSVSLEELVDELLLVDKRVAVEWNREIIPRSRFPEVRLQDGDRIEIVHAIGGG